MSKGSLARRSLGNKHAWAFEIVLLRKKDLPEPQRYSADISNGNRRGRRGKWVVVGSWEERQGLWEVGKQLASIFIGVNLGMD